MGIPGCVKNAEQENVTRKLKERKEEELEVQLLVGEHLAAAKSS